jgi:hypothetical protein
MWLGKAGSGQCRPLPSHFEPFRFARVAVGWAYAVLKTATIPSITCGMPVFGSVTKHKTA